MRNSEHFDFRSSLPYQNSSELNAAWSRLLANSKLMGQLARMFPKLELGAFLNEPQSMDSADEFQRRVISRIVAEIEAQTTDGLSVSGLENFLVGQKYVLFSNHRDIVCDPAWVSYVFFLNQIPTPQICLGDNLLTHPVIVDLVKMNKGVTVKRGLPPRDLLKWSGLLSEFIRRQIDQKIDSVWIAQREGRAKDGDDRTHPGVLKMLAMAGPGSMLDHLEALHLVPLAISYEYDPCDAMKAYELFVTARDGAYIKSAGEDALSMMNGITGYKGRVHVAFGASFSRVPLAVREWMSRGSEGQIKKEVLQYFCSQLDEQMHRLYRLWPSHYIAMDLVEAGSTYVHEYTASQKAFFLDRLEKQLDTLRASSPRPELRSSSGWKEDDLNEVRMRILEAYAMPVRNFRMMRSPLQGAAVRSLNGSVEPPLGVQNSGAMTD